MDAYHQWGSDLVASASGDLLTVDDADETVQRVLRRLMTTQSDYWWHMDYGAGLPLYVGLPADVAGIRGVIKAQMMLEERVAKTPEPVVVAQLIPNGVAVDIQYTDAPTGQTKALSFNLNS